MKLTKVEMYGFKSFAQRTTFTIGDGITAIVGPNGCGKSNLVDAIQWALGEQRPTRLRSSGMADVVYRGDATSVDHAEVSLHFDNAAGRLPHPSPEVKVTRRLGKDGESVYLVNDTTAKLKDVRDLFLDTGLGVGGYSFMAQGQIDAILRASASERRVLIEEAAGTSRYRVRRKDAVRRLERTEQDIARASDLLAELERQVRSLKSQAGRARTYVEKRDRLRAVVAVLHDRRRRELQAALAELNDGKEAARTREDAARAELATGEVSLGAREEEQSARAAAISDARTVHAERRSRGEHLVARLAELEERGAQVTGERAEGVARRGEVAQQSAELAKSEREAEERVVQVAAEETKRREERAAAQRRRLELDRKASEIELAVGELEKEELDLVDHEQRARSELGDVESHLKVLANSRHKLEGRSAERTRTIADVAAAARAQREVVAQRTAERRALEQELSADDDVLARLFNERQTLADKLRHRQARIEGERSRLLVVEDAIARHEGVSEQVRDLLERAAAGDPELEGIEGIVADLVTAPAEVARALEAALGPLSEALVVADRASANRILKRLRRDGLERIRILSRAELPRPDSELAWNELLRASGFDKKDGALLSALVGQFDLLPADVAMEQCSPAPGRALVSHDGEVMLSPFESVSRGRGEFLGLITRRNERERLDRSVHSGESECREHETVLARMQDEIALRERDREARSQRRAEAAGVESAALSELQGAQNRLALLRDELELDAREMVDLERRRTQLDGERRELAAARAQLEARRGEVRARRGALAQEATRGHGERQKAEETLVALDLEVAKLAERAKAAADARTSARARLRERQEELQRADRRIAELAEEDAQLAETKAAAAAERQGLLAEVERLAQEIAALAADLEKHKAESAGLRTRVHELRGVVETTSRELQAFELREQEQRLHLEVLEAKIFEELLLAPDDLARQVAAVRAGEATHLVLPPPPPAPVEVASADAGVAVNGTGATNGTAGTNGSALAAPPAAPAVPPPPALPIHVELDPALFETALATLHNEAERLRNVIARIGPVNVTAIEELQAVEGRAIFLSKQKQDLTEARAKLKEMIEEIDRECESRFEKTFEDVRAHFRDLFRRLFAGGRADLQPVEGDEPGEPGVDIVAAPPGKDPRSLALLSGGERALTAVALLFALFSTRPSPFCVLDEVDAPLDDSNKARFTAMVREFLKGTQFLIVTHAKVTMAAADVLYGVTMQGDGVSKPIAIRFEQEKAKEHAAG
jgi:chromosome segregation protein